MKWKKDILTVQRKLFNVKTDPSKANQIPFNTFKALVHNMKYFLHTNLHFHNMHRGGEGSQNQFS